MCDYMHRMFLCSMIYACAYVYVYIMYVYVHVHSCLGQNLNLDVNPPETLSITFEAGFLTCQNLIKVD